MPTGNPNVIVQLRVLDRLLAIEVGCLTARSIQFRTVTSHSHLEALAEAIKQQREQLHKALRDAGGIRNVLDRVGAQVVISVRALVDKGRRPSHTVLADLSVAHKVSSRVRLLQALAREEGSRSLLVLTDDLNAVSADTVAALQTILESVARDPHPEVISRGSQRGATMFSNVTESITHSADRLTGWLSENRNQVSGHAGQMGVPDGEKLPINNYDELTASEAAAAVRQLDDTDEIEQIAAYERRNKNRSTVADAAASHCNALIGDQN